MSDSFKPDAPVKDSFTPDAPAAQDYAKYSDTHSPLVGGILDTFGATGRPGARTSADVLLRPEGALENAAQLAVTAPLITAGGMGLGAVASKIMPAAAKAAPLVGRALTSGAVGGAEKAARGGSAWDIGQSFLQDAALSAGGEKVLGAVGSKIPGGKSVSMIEDKLGSQQARTGGKFTKGSMPNWLRIPAISKSPLTTQEAMDALGKASGQERRVLVEEIAHELDAVQQAAGVRGAKAGAIFRDAVKDSRWTPEWATKFADAIRTKPLALGAFDSPVSELDVPLGPAAIGAGAMAGKESFGKMAHGILPRLAR